MVTPSWMREAAAYGGAMESSKLRSSSGCQSGWTLYLDHSNGNGMRYLPCDPAAQRWMVLQADDDVEDSMASDASSGPRSRQRDQEEETRLHLEQRPQGYIGQHSYSSSVHRSSSSGSGGLGSSTWSRSSQGEVKGHVGRRGVVVHGGEATQYREIVVDEEDELDDTASSSAVFSNPVAMVHVNFSSLKHQRSTHELCNI